MRSCRVNFKAIKSKPLGLIYTDPDFLVVNKVLGIDAISGKELSQNDIRGLGIDGYVGRSKQLVSVNSLGVYETGILMISRSPASGISARQLWRAGQLWKPFYWILVEGRLKGRGKSGVINVPLMHGVPHSSGITSISHWRVLKETDDRTLIEVNPRTTVVDQIELHCRLCLNATPVQSLGAHLARIEGNLPSGSALDLFANPHGELAKELASLGWYS
jgi:23S rRNA-/tRNA-specific pseudouridylate synthase